MNSLMLDCSLSTNGLKGSQIIVTVSNLNMEGARLHHNTLMENAANSPSVITINDIKLAWVPEVCKYILYFYKSSNHSIYSYFLYYLL